MVTVLVLLEQKINVKLNSLCGSAYLYFDCKSTDFSFQDIKSPCLSNLKKDNEVKVFYLAFPFFAFT